MDGGYQAPLSMGFSRQEFWSGLPFSSPGDLLDPGIEPGSPAGQADALPSEPPGKQCRRPGSNSWVMKIPWRRYRLPTPVFLGFLGSSDGKESACNAEDLGSISELERSPGGGHGNPLQYSFLENPHGQRSLTGNSPWGHKELDMIERLAQHSHHLRDLGYFV